jgi:hypothetical protein
MRNFLIFLLLAAVSFTGCKRPAAAANPVDVLESRLRTLAGTDATNCGRVAPGADVKPASDCAMQANSSKHPFYVGYSMNAGEMGLITFAFAGDANGKVYRAEYNPKGWQGPMTGGDLTDGTQVFSLACSAPLRVAQSGRVTCLPPMAMGAGGMNPHGGLMMPPPGTANPHQGMTMPPPGTANPHAGMAMPSH